MSKSKTSAQTVIDDIGLLPRGSKLGAASLFRPSTTYCFNEGDEFNTIGQFGRKNASEAEKEQRRRDALKTAYDIVLDPTYGSAKTYDAFRHVKADLNVENPAFVSWTETENFIVKTATSAIEGYLRRTAEFWRTSSNTNSAWAPCVLIRPILQKPADADAVGYLLCPAEITTNPDAWKDAGFKKPGAQTPLTPAPVEEYLQRFGAADGKFSVPVALSSATPGEFTYYWANFAAAAFPDDKPPKRAVPHIGLNLDGVNANVLNIMTGPDASSTITTPAPLPFPDPFAPENLRGKFIATGDPSYFGDKSVIEDKDKLIAAIGTAAAAAITIGIAKVYA